MEVVVDEENVIESPLAAGATPPSQFEPALMLPLAAVELHV
jgi:hypothetical protein